MQRNLLSPTGRLMDPPIKYYFNLIACEKFTKSGSKLVEHLAKQI